MIIYPSRFCNEERGGKKKKLHDAEDNSSLLALIVYRLENQEIISHFPQTKFKERLHRDTIPVCLAFYCIRDLTLLIIKKMPQNI